MSMLDHSSVCDCSLAATATPMAHSRIGLCVWAYIDLLVVRHTPGGRRQRWREEAVQAQGPSCPSSNEHEALHKHLLNWLYSLGRGCLSRRSAPLQHKCRSGTSTATPAACEQRSLRLFLLQTAGILFWHLTLTIMTCASPAKRQKQRHPGFPSGPPRWYWLGGIELICGKLTGTEALSILWPLMLI